MRLKRIIPLVALIFMAFVPRVQADHGGRPLTSEELQRIQEVKETLGEVDGKTLQQTIRELERSPHPLINLEMHEAMAKAYTDIVKELAVEWQKKKEWLYSMICLNMAYLQFGGGTGKPGSTTELNRLIRRKLVRYLPAEVLRQPGFLHVLE